MQIYWINSAERVWVEWRGFVLVNGRVHGALLDDGAAVTIAQLSQTAFIVYLDCNEGAQHRRRTWPDKMLGCCCGEEAPIHSVAVSMARIPGSCFYWLAFIAECATNGARISNNSNSSQLNDTFSRIRSLAFYEWHIYIYRYERTEWISTWCSARHLIRRFLSWIYSVFILIFVEQTQKEIEITFQSVVGDAVLLPKPKDANGQQQK